MEGSRICDSPCHLTPQSWNLSETMLRDAGTTKELVQGYAIQLKQMETNRIFVSKNTREGAGAQWNLLATGGSLKRIPELGDEVP